METVSSLPSVRVLGQRFWLSCVRAHAPTRRRNLFRGQRVRIETGDRALTALQVEELAWLLELHDMKFEWGTNGTQTSLPGIEPPRPPPPPSISNVAVWDDAALCPRTLRSGQSVRYAGHVVVLGDVNPGAEIVACGRRVGMGTAARSGSCRRIGQ